MAVKKQSKKIEKSNKTEKTSMDFRVARIQIRGAIADDLVQAANSYSIFKNMYLILRHRMYAESKKAAEKLKEAKAKNENCDKVSAAYRKAKAVLSCLCSPKAVRALFQVPNPEKARKAKLTRDSKMTPRKLKQKRKDGEKKRKQKQQEQAAKNEMYISEGREKATYLSKNLKKDRHFKQLIAIGSRLQTCIIPLVVEELNAAFQSFYTKQLQGDKLARPPKARKISSLSTKSIPLENNTFSVTEDGKVKILVLKDKFSFNIDIGILKGIIPDLDLIRNSEVCIKDGFVSLHITYNNGEKRRRARETRCRNGENAEAFDYEGRQTKRAAIDLGLLDTMAIFVDDEQTQSKVIRGTEFIQYNMDMNVKIDKVNSVQTPVLKDIESFSRCAADVNRLDFVGEFELESWYPEFANLKSQQKIITKAKGTLLFDRHNFFSDAFHKLAVRTLEDLRQAGVTELYLARNVTELKQKMNTGKNNNRRFHAIPFGKLLGNLEYWAPEYGVEIKWIDEKYTSKSSVLNFMDVITRVEAGEKLPKSSPIVYGGRRGSKVKQGQNPKKPDSSRLFHDQKLGILQANVAAAANHVQKGANAQITWNKAKIQKLICPKIIKGNALKSYLDRNHGGEKKTTTFISDQPTQKGNRQNSTNLNKNSHWTKAITDVLILRSRE